MLTSVQGKAAKVIIGAYKGTSLLALDVEAFLAPIDYTLEELALRAIVRMHSTPVYKTVAKDRLALTARSRKAKSRKKPLLEILEDIYEARYSPLGKIKKLSPVTVMPDWIPPPTDILPRDRAVREWRRICRKGEGMIYTDSSGINNKIGAAIVYGPTIFILYIGSSLFFTVYSAELLGILIAIMHIKAEFSHLLQVVRTFHIFVDNQAAIMTIRDPGTRSGQGIVERITQNINKIRADGIMVILHWIPAHDSHEGNELADTAAKKATGLKTSRQDGKIIERDSEHTANRLDLGYYIIAPLKHKMRQEADIRWHKEWSSETRGKALRRVAPLLSKQIIRIHRGL